MSRENKLKNSVLRHPCLSVMSVVICWFVIIMFFTGMTTSLLMKDFGDSITTFIGHLAGIVFIITILWRFKWLKSAGIYRVGNYQVWLISIAGSTYFALASLYSFYGNLRFDVSNLVNIASSGSIILSSITNCMGEEILFRGVLLHILIRSFGDTRKGIVKSVVLTSGIFALFHILQVVFYELSLASSLFLVLEVFIVSFWWASMVISSGSIWPAFWAHFCVNTLVALQGIAHSIIQPEPQIYYELLLFSLPIGVTGYWILFKLPVQKYRYSIDKRKD